MSYLKHDSLKYAGMLAARINQEPEQVGAQERPQEPEIPPGPELVAPQVVARLRELTMPRYESSHPELIAWAERNTREGRLEKSEKGNNLQVYSVPGTISSSDSYGVPLLIIDGHQKEFTVYDYDYDGRLKRSKTANIKDGIPEADVNRKYYDSGILSSEERYKREFGKHIHSRTNYDEYGREISSWKKKGALHDGVTLEDSHARYPEGAYRSYPVSEVKNTYNSETGDLFDSEETRYLTKGQGQKTTRSYRPDKSVRQILVMNFHEDLPANGRIEYYDAEGALEDSFDYKDMNEMNKVMANRGKNLSKE